MTLQVFSAFGILSKTEAEKVPEAVIITVFRTPVLKKQENKRKEGIGK